MGWCCDRCVPLADLFPLPDSWVDISSQPSSSSLSSANDDAVQAGFTAQHDPRTRRRRTLRPGVPSHLSIHSRAPSTSSQDEYEESESEEDRVMSSSGEDLVTMAGQRQPYHRSPLGGASSSASDSVPGQVSEDDDDGTAVSYPIQHDNCFTPQPNAFSHPPSSGHMRNASQPVAGSYFPSAPRPSAPRPPRRQSSMDAARQQSHLPQNILSPSYNAAAQHDEALRTSLSTLLSCAAAARGLPKTDGQKRPQTAATAQPAPRGNRVEPMSFRLIPESATAPLNVDSPPQFQEPTFQPTIRRSSTSTSASSSPQHHQINKEKRKAHARTRSTSRERRLKKARRSSSSSQEELGVAPTPLTWVVSLGVVLFFSAVSFSAGYSIGKEAGHIEAGGFGDGQLRGCAKEASRSSLGLKRSLARSAVQV